MEETQLNQTEGDKNLELSSEHLKTFEIVLFT